MSYQRFSESRRSPSARRANNSGRRDGRTGQRSPDPRYQRSLDYRRRTYRNRTPDYGERHRRRSPSEARYGRDSRAYRGGRSAPYRRSRSRSPWQRRSHSVESYSKDERLQLRDIPSARFGSKASYLRSRGAHRGPSRSPSRGGRRSPLVRGHRGKRDASHSDSRGRYRERRDEFRADPSPERRLSKGRTPDRCDSPYYKERGTRQPRSSNERISLHRSTDRHGSKHSVGRRLLPIQPRDRRTFSPTGHSAAHSRHAKDSRSESRNRASVVTSRRPSDMESRTYRKPRNTSREFEGATSPRHSLSPRGCRQRSSSGTRRRGVRTPDRRSPSHDRASRRRSSSGSRRRGDGTPNRLPSDHGKRSHRRSSSGSRRRRDGTPIVPPNDNHSPRRSQSGSRRRSSADPRQSLRRHEHRSQRRPSCSSADCPTPDFASSKPLNAGGEQINLHKRSSGGESKQSSSREASRHRRAENESQDKHHRDPSEASSGRQGGPTKARQDASGSRSHSIRRGETQDGQDQAREQWRSRQATPRVQQEAGLEQEPKGSLETSELPVDSEGPTQDGNLRICAPLEQRDEAILNRATRLSTDSRQARSPSLPRPASRRRSEPRQHDDTGRSTEPPKDNLAADGASDSRLDQAVKYTNSTAEGDRRPSDGDKTVVKRKIIATNPTESSPAIEMYRKQMESPEDRHFRLQRLIPGRVDRLSSAGMNKFQLMSSRRWHRFERDERLDHPRLQNFKNASRSVRIMGARAENSPYFPHHQRTPLPFNDMQRWNIDNGPFQRAMQPNVRLPRRGREFLQPNRISGGTPGKGASERRQVAASRDPDGKWSHDLFEQLANEPERKRPRFNLYYEQRNSDAYDSG